MTNEELFNTVEEILNSYGFTLGSRNAELGTLPTEGVSYVRVNGELVSVSPLKVCMVPVHPRQIGKSLSYGNGVLIDAEKLDTLKEWFNEQGAIVDGFRLSSCQLELKRKLARSKWIWSAWPEDGCTLVAHPQSQLTDLLALLADATKSSHCSSRPDQNSEALPGIFSPLLDRSNMVGTFQPYDIQQMVWHLCGQQVILRLQGRFQASERVLFLDPGATSTSWYDPAGIPLQSCPFCGRKLSTDQIHLTNPW